MNYAQKRQAISKMISGDGHHSLAFKGLTAPDDIDKLIVLTELAVGAGQCRSHFPTVRDAHESWLEDFITRRSR